MYTQAATHSTTDVANLNADPGYQPRSEQWLEKGRSGGKRSKWIVRAITSTIYYTLLIVLQVIGSVAALLGLIAIGVAVGVVVSNNNKKSNSGGGKPGSNTPTTVPQTDPNDPSTFIKSPDLHQSFYGLAYTPEGSQLPGCGNKLCKSIRYSFILPHADPHVNTSQYYPGYPGLSQYFFLCPFSFISVFSLCHN